MSSENTSFKQSVRLKEKNTEVHSIPCKIDYTGPANVSKYFLRGRQENNKEKSTFRGHLLDGFLYQLNDDFNMFIAKKLEKGSRQVYDVEQVTNSFHLWNWDQSSLKENSVYRALEYLAIAEDLAADD